MRCHGKWRSGQISERETTRVMVCSTHSVAPRGSRWPRRASPPETFARCARPDLLQGYTPTLPLPFRQPPRSTFCEMFPKQSLSWYVALQAWRLMDHGGLNARLHPRHSRSVFGDQRLRAASAQEDDPPQARRADGDRRRSQLGLVDDLVRRSESRQRLCASVATEVHGVYDTFDKLIKSLCSACSMFTYVIGIKPPMFI